MPLFFLGGELGPYQHNVVLAEAYLHTKWHLDPSIHLAAIDTGQKLGAVPLSGGGSWVPIQHKVAWAKAYRHTKWHLNPSSRLYTTVMGQKLGRELSPFLGELGPPSNTMSPRPRPTSVPSGILINPAVWPE